MIRAILFLTGARRWLRLARRIAMAVVPAAIGLVLGIIVGIATAHHPVSVTPSGLCAVKAVAGRQDATVVVPGDAGWFWLPGATGYREYACTDGTLVPVENYGKG